MLLLALAVICAANPVPRLEPAPKWVEPVELPLLSADCDGAVWHRFDERQVRVAPGIEQTYYRNAFTALNAEGIDTVAHTEIVFNPVYEKLTMHGVWLWHDGVRRDAWRTTDVRVLDQEEHMEDRVYDGRRSVVLETRNVRVGDTVEVAWSTLGGNPVMGGRYYGRFHTQFDGSVDRLLIRVLWEKPSPPEVRALNGANAPEERQLGNALELKWTGDDLDGFDEEPNAPPDAQARPSIEISEWKSWTEVATWAESLFNRKERSPLLQAELTRLRALPEGEPQLREAVRFVQDDVRYLSASLGVSSHRPHSPQWVLERGFGDCKDKTLLTVTLLRALGADAVPALVNTDSGAALDDWLPSPYAFNHVIVRAVIDGDEKWIDATSTFERGALSERTPPPYERALLAATGSHGLVTIPPAELDEPTWDIEQHWEVPQHNGPAHLTVTTHARAASADFIRRALASKSRAEWTRELADLRRDSEKLDLTAEPLEWTDDPDSNELVRIERYEVPRFFDSDWRHDFDANAVWNQLEEPGAAARSVPLAVTHPVNVREVIIFDGPEDLDPAPIAPSHYESPAYAYDFKGTVDGPRLRLEHRLRSKADRVEPAELEDHARTVKQIAKKLAYGVELPPQATVHAAPRDGQTGRLAVLVALLVGLALVFVRRRAAAAAAAGSTAPGAPATDDRPGESPRSALAVRDLADAVGTFRTKACRNAHGWTSAIEPDGTVVLGDSRVTVLKRRCAICGDAEVRYFKVPPDAPY